MGGDIWTDLPPLDLKEKYYWNNTATNKHKISADQQVIPSICFPAGFGDWRPIWANGSAA